MFYICKISESLKITGFSSTCHHTAQNIRMIRHMESVMCSPDCKCLNVLLIYDIICGKLHDNNTHVTYYMVVIMAMPL